MSVEYPANWVWEVYTARLQRLKVVYYTTFFRTPQEGCYYSNYSDYCNTILLIPMRIACLKFGETKALEKIVIRSRVYSTQQARVFKKSRCAEWHFFFPPRPPPPSPALNALNSFLWAY